MVAGLVLGPLGSVPWEAPFTERSLRRAGPVHTGQAAPNPRIQSPVRSARLLAGPPGRPHSAGRPGDGTAVSVGGAITGTAARLSLEETAFMCQRLAGNKK